MRLGLKRIVKMLDIERQQLSDRINHISSAIDALNGNTPGRGPRKGRKMSAAHRRAIKEGIAKAKAAKK